MATQTAVPAAIRRPGRGAGVALVLVVWVLGWALFRGRDTLPLAPSDTTWLHQRINDFNDALGDSRNTNPVFLYFFNEIRLVIDNFVTGLQALISQPSVGRPVPVLGWLGVTAIATYVAGVFGNARVAVLTAAGFTLFGLQGLWKDSMDTLALTLSALLVSLLIGIPLGIWAGLSPRVNKIITPVLDFMQIMPPFVYLAPLTLLFLIGPASSVITTLIYAMPPAIRITAHAIRTVPATTVEATTSLGSTKTQELTKVLLPMARRTIVLGINQAMMAALSMVTIAALIGAPGLGQTVIRALQSLNVGLAVNAGLAIVIMAIVLDRVTTAASQRAEKAMRHQGKGALDKYRRPLIIGGGIVTLICVYVSYTYVWAADFPAALGSLSLDLGSVIARAGDSVSNWAQTNLAAFTGPFKDLVTSFVLDPVQNLLTQSPWWLVVAAILAISALVGGWRAAVTSGVCLAVILFTGLWSDSMATLAATLVATVLVIAIAVVVGVWMGRSSRADGVIRPVLDGAQTMPSFVYLVPFLALFAASRFTGIVAAVVFAAPIAIKLIADGIRGVSPTTVEAATAAGSNRWQLISKVQLPMSRSSLVLATNQGMIYVLSMVVVAGLVGAGALGFDVVAGFVQTSLFGKGLAAGVAIVMLGIMLDRTTQAAARRSERPAGRH